VRWQKFPPALERSKGPPFVFGDRKEILRSAQHDKAIFSNVFSALLFSVVL
jgi:hypothetical protein